MGHNTIRDYKKKNKDITFAKNPVDMKEKLGKLSKYEYKACSE